MALIKCIECSREISSDAEICPHCGKKTPPRSREFNKVSPLFVVLAISGAIGVFIYMAHKSVEPAPAPTSTPQAMTADSNGGDSDEGVITKDPSVAFSEYAGKIQSGIIAIATTSQIYTSKIHQDVSFSNLDAFRKDAEELKNRVISETSNITMLPPGLGLTDEDADYFEKVQQTAGELLGDDIDIAVDIAVYANTGLSEPTDNAAQTSKMKRDRKAFESAVFAGYKHFGHTRADIDLQTLMLKEAQPN